MTVSMLSFISFLGWLGRAYRLKISTTFDCPFGTEQYDSGMRATATCKVCKTALEYYTTEKSGLYCSRKCWSTVAVANLGTRMSGKRWSAKQHRKFKRSVSGANHHHWVGDKIGYTALHRWVERHRGKPKRCGHCGTRSPYRHYEWANVSHKYLRDLKDFIRLCKQCHHKFDTARHN